MRFKKTISGNISELVKSGRPSISWREKPRRGGPGRPKLEPELRSGPNNPPLAFWKWVARHLPAKLVYECATLVGRYASMGHYKDMDYIDMTHIGVCRVWYKEKIDGTSRVKL